MITVYGSLQSFASFRFHVLVIDLPQLCLTWFGIGLSAGFSGWLSGFIWLSVKGALNVAGSGD